MVQQLIYAGFLRKKNGLNCLPTFKKLSKILQKPGGLQFRIVNMSISSFIQNTKSELLSGGGQYRLGTGIACRHWPIIYLYNFSPGKYPLTHAVVLTGWRKYGKKILLKVRNSSKDQLGEHEVEFKVTQNMNTWNLAADQCIYIKFL